MNTHHAYIMRLDSSVEVIAVGPEDYVRGHLAEWLSKTPLKQYETAYVSKFEVVASND